MQRLPLRLINEFTFQEGTTVACDIGIQLLTAADGDGCMHVVNAGMRSRHSGLVINRQ